MPLALVTPLCPLGATWSNLDQLGELNEIDIWQTKHSSAWHRTNALALDEADACCKLEAAHPAVQNNEINEEAEEVGQVNQRTKGPEILWNFGEPWWNHVIYQRSTNMSGVHSVHMSSTRAESWIRLPSSPMLPMLLCQLGKDLAQHQSTACIQPSCRLLSETWWDMVRY